MSKNINNCKNCLYANVNEDLSVDCDKKYLVTGKTIHIEVDKVESSCPAHSDIRIEEWRYDRKNNYIDEAEDICSCGRMVDLSNEDTYRIIGSNLFCKICADEIILGEER